MKKLFLLGTVILGLSSVSSYARAKGVLVVGTQSEVQTILQDSGVMPQFSEVDPSAYVAVRLIRNKMTVYEGGAVEKIFEVVGEMVEGGVAYTLETVSELWDILEDLTGDTVNVGKAALSAAIKVVSEGVALVKSGVDFTVETAKGVLAFVADLAKDLANAFLP